MKTSNSQSIDPTEDTPTPQGGLAHAEALKATNNQVATLVELTDKWMSYVGQDHHKDRDCHWYIECDFAYGNPPTYQAQHYGYIFHDDVEMPERATYQEAETDLLDLLKQAIDNQREHCQLILDNPNDWDEWDIKQAKSFFELFGAVTPVTDLAKSSPETSSADTQIRPGEHKKQELERGK